MLAEGEVLGDEFDVEEEMEATEKAGLMEADEPEEEDDDEMEEIEDQDDED